MYQRSEESVEKLKKELEIMEKQTLRYAQDLAKIFKGEREKAIQLDLTRKQLVRSARMALTGQLAASMAHEINNVITPAIGNIDLILLQQEALEPKLVERIGRVKKSLDKVSSMLRQLLDFSRKQTEKKEKVNVKKLILNALNFLEYRIKKKAIKIQLAFSPDLPEIYGDMDQLEQVFTNLIVNAIEAMDVKGILEITIQYLPEKDYLEISFKDNGRGIAPEDIDHIFEPFYTTKEAGKGTGLGLFVSYGIIEKHGGIIDVKSELEKGTTFTIRLPVSYR